jgi:hypothetical protein
MTLFIEGLALQQIEGLRFADLITPWGAEAQHGNFLAFRTRRAGEIQAKLAGVHVHCDHRGDRLRFGFGICIDAADLDQALSRIRCVTGS